MQAMGVDVRYEASELKTAASTFALQNFEEVQHFYQKSESLVSKAGHCLKHGCRCQSDMQDVDILTGGPPCKPFIGFRRRDGE